MIPWIHILHFILFLLLYMYYIIYIVFLRITSVYRPLFNPYTLITVNNITRSSTLWNISKVYLLDRKWWKTTTWCATLTRVRRWAMRQQSVQIRPVPWPPTGWPSSRAISVVSGLFTCLHLQISILNNCATGLISFEFCKECNNCCYTGVSASHQFGPTQNDS